jgi:pimeloyl-ACP methyl ester carboxylesterase
MKRLFAKPVSDAVVSGMWDFIAENDGHLLLPHTIRYVSERVRFKDRWIGALTRAGRSGLPVHIAWGARDPVALVAIADRLLRETPGATSTRWPLGHYPQLEDPVLVSRDIVRFMDAVDSAAMRG